MTCQEVKHYLGIIKEKIPPYYLDTEEGKKYKEALEIAESYINYVELGFKLAKSNGEK